MQRFIAPAGFTLFLIAIDWYAFQAFRQFFPSTGTGRRWCITAYWLFSAGLLLLLFYFRFLAEPGKHRLLMVFGLSVYFIFLFSKLVLCLFLLAEDVWRVLVLSFLQVRKNFFQGPPVFSPSRSAALAKIAAGIAAVPLVSLVYGMVKGAYNYKIRKVELRLKGLPPAFEGVKLIQISDIHAGSLYDPEAVARGVGMLMSEKPDMVFFTGDMVNNEAAEFDALREIFCQIKAPLGIFSVLGNHDYGDYKYWESQEAKQANFSDLMQHHRQMGWQLLMDEHVLVEKNGQKIAVAGIQNWGARGNFPKYGDLSKALKDLENPGVLLLLSHDPSHWEAQVLPDFPEISAMFSGHTHGMQFGVEIPGFRWSPVQYMYRQWAGLYQQGNSQLYVNRGFGFLGYPGRVGIWPEITSFTLRSA
jgi:predicted MPP superfamily phosphohydrolase